MSLEGNAPLTESEYFPETNNEAEKTGWKLTLRTRVQLRQSTLLAWGDIIKSFFWLIRSISCFVALVNLN